MNSSASTHTHQANSRFLTLRSIIFGFLGIYIIAGLSGFHDTVLGGTRMIGNQMPASAFFYFFFLGTAWNGLWQLLDRLFRRNGALSRLMGLSVKELVFVMVVSLVSCYAPTSGLFRYFHRQLVLPWHYLSSHSAWASHNLLTEYLRPEFFPEPWPGTPEIRSSTQYETVYSGFVMGLAKGKAIVGFGEIPLSAWIRPMLYWTPLLFLMSIVLVCIQFIVHRQWAHHEQIAYPLAQVASEFARSSNPHHGVPDLFRNRLFWWGFLPLFFLLLLQYLSRWYPDSVPDLSVMMPNLRTWWVPLQTYMPEIKRFFGHWSLSGQTLYFTFLGISYFVSSEIALTIGLSNILACLFCILFYHTTGEMFAGDTMEATRSGGFIGFALILLYTGRTYFLSVFLYALGIRRRNPVAEKTSAEDASEEATEAAEKKDYAAPDEIAVTAARLLFFAFIAFVMLLAWMCQSWLIALCLALLLILAFTVLSRMLCETGIPFLVTGWQPAAFLINLLGPAAIGPHALTYIKWSTSILSLDPREALMPYVATATKIADDNNIKLKRIFWWVLFAIGISLVIAWFSSMFSFYNYGAMTDAWAAANPPVMYLDDTARHFANMKAAGVFEKSLDASVLGRLSLISPHKLNAHYTLYGALAVIALAAMRFRFSKFPIHPILILIVGTYPSQAAWACFLIGWFIKQIIVRFGGGGVYQKLKPFFIGIICSELLMVGLTLFIDFAYYFIHGSPSTTTLNLMPG